MVWDSAAAVANSSKFEEHSYRISDALDMPCVPVGLSWAACLQDASLSFTEASSNTPTSPNSHAAFVFASTLFAHFFEKSSSASSYDYNGLGPVDEAAVIGHAYTKWNTARTSSHYTGQYTGGAFRSFAVPHVFDGRAWCGMGTSTESRTRVQLKRVISGNGGTQTGDVHINGYDYSSPYFHRILTASVVADPPVQSAAEMVTQRDFSFGLGRFEDKSTPFASKMQLLHQLDPDTGGNTRFVTFNYAFPNSPEFTFSIIHLKMKEMIETGRSNPESHVIPNFAALGRAWLEQPGINTFFAPDGDHLADLGYFLQAAMIYTVSTGQSPASNPSAWSNDEFYLLNMGYKMVMELSRLQKVQLPPMAYKGAYTTPRNTPVAVKVGGLDFDALPVNIIMKSAPIMGTLSGTYPNLTYTPKPGFVGTDAFSYVVDNGITPSAGQLINVEVQAATPATLAWERGRLNQIGNASWTTVTLKNSYANMVVVATPVYDNSSVPMVARIRNTAGNQFQIRAQAADGLDQPKPGVSFEYFVVESGVYSAAIHGVKMEAGTWAVAQTDRPASTVGVKRTYKNTYTKPIVLGQVMTHNDPKFSYFWSSADNRRLVPNATQCRFGKTVGEDPQLERQPEMLGYVVIEAGLGSLPGGVYYNAVGTDRKFQGMNLPPKSDMFAALFPYSEGAVACQAGMINTDGSWAVIWPQQGVTEQQILLITDEDTTMDAERSNVTESAHYIVFSSSSDPAVHLPAGPRGDSDQNGIADLVQFTMGLEYGSKPAESPVQLTLFGAPGGTKIPTLEVFRRQNLAFFGVTQQLLVSDNLVNWSDLATFGLSYQTTVLDSFNTSSPPYGKVDKIRYSISAPQSQKGLFFKIQSQ
jgi:hypothetical protein